MWKVNIGFALALAALSLCAYGTFDILGKLRNLHGEKDREAIAYYERGCEIILASSALSVIVTVLSIALINRDVGSQQEAEARLALAHENLEARIRERTADLGRANNELEKARTDLEVRVRERTADLARANGELRQMTTLQRAILDSANYSIISTDAYGVIRTFNHAAQSWLGYAPAEVVGQQTPVIFHDVAELAARQAELSDELRMPVESGFEVFVTRARYGVTEEHEWTYVRKDGTRFPVLLSVTALHDEVGRVTGFLVIGSDITQRKRAEEELKRVTKAAEAANQAKSEFLANMSHELRTPLNSVIGFTTLLLKNKAGNLRDQDITFLERVLDNGRHLLKLINEVLDLAKVEAGRMHLELDRIDLGDLVRSTLAGLEGQLRGKDVRLIADVPSHLAGLETDPGKLKQVLINLVGNAIKFTERGSVTVRVRTGPADGRPLALDVIDTGVGIPADKLHTIFEAFQQADASTTRQYGGTGLGLTIARSLCRLMGYGLEVRSRVSQGSIFRVVLGTKADGTPALPPPSPTREIVLPPELGQHNLNGKHVLIIDDDSDSRILLTQYIEECGCRVLAVDCGEQGLRLAEKFEADLIVLDLMMPGMSGWDVLKALKTHPTLSRLPVVVVSIVAHENRGTILGAVDLLDKPVSREALHAMLRRNLLAPKGRALVVDDNADARRLLSALLAEAGFETCEAINGADALARLERFDANLVILDLMMPVMDGFAFLDALRRDPHHLRLPVVVVTAKDLTSQEADRLGADGSVVLRKGDELALDLKRVVGEVLVQRAEGAIR